MREVKSHGVGEASSRGGSICGVGGLLCLLVSMFEASISYGDVMHEYVEAAKSILPSAKGAVNGAVADRDRRRLVRVAGVLLERETKDGDLLELPLRYLSIFEIRKAEY
jgi:hypothetical protein